MVRTFFIAGVQFRPTEIKKKISELMVGDKLILDPEPTNKFDPNAVRIMITISEDTFLGYVPKKFSSEVSAMIEAGIDIECIVDEINPKAKAWEMCKVTVKASIEDEESSMLDHDFVD